MKKPSVTKSNHVLPFRELSPAQFERLCLWLVEREGYLRPEHLGEAGNEQGRDVIAYRAADSGEQLWYFQCKRYGTIGAATLIKEVEKYNELVIADPAKKAFGIVFVTNATLSAAVREKVRGFCCKHGYECQFWARTELDMFIKKHPAIVAEFFNLPTAAKKGGRIKSEGSRNIIIQRVGKGASINIVSIKTPVAKSRTPPLTRDRISIARLPTTEAALFGRDAELQMLDDAWANPNTKIIAFVAWGGVGKTALVNHWLKQCMTRDNYRGAERVYGWSFYSQGTSERAASADLFIDQTLRWFGDTDPTSGSPWDKGERLARFIRQTRTLLVLDGLEPLQHPPGPQEGRLKDAALQALLCGLAAEQPGLCVISTRERVGDLVEFENATVVQHELEHLSPQAGAQLLRALQVKGDDDEFQQAVAEYGGHALALTLLGSYLVDVCEGDIRRRNEIESLEADARHGRHAERVMRAYEKWLGEGIELAVLRLLGLFDRPAEGASIAALRNTPAIPGLTEALQNLKEREWQQALAKLRRIKLLGGASASEPDTLDAHPLVREHFKQQLKGERPDAWREANNRLYEHLTRTTKEFPDTVEEMSPLFAAVSHGCAAGRYQETLDEVYRRRIRRGKEHFGQYKLGAFGAHLVTVADFFDKRWEYPLTRFTAADKAFVLEEAGICLKALGRLKEAIQPAQAALKLRELQADWKNAAINAGYLSHLYQTIGDLPKAVGYALQNVELADRSGSHFWRIRQRTTLGNALHQLGRFSEAEAAFREAEMMQREDPREHSLLDSIWGGHYCELLLDQGRYHDVQTRAAQIFEWTKAENLLLDIALDYLFQGRAYLLQVQNEGAGDFSQVAIHLNQAVEGLRKSGRQDYLPRGLLARAELYRFTGDHGRAERDLAEVLRIATRGGMGLHLADYHLESARLQLAQGNQDKAREHWTTAKEMIERMGYHRRDKEVDEIAQQPLSVIATDSPSV